MNKIEDLQRELQVAYTEGNEIMIEKLEILLSEAIRDRANMQNLNEVVPETKSKNETVIND